MSKRKSVALLVAGVLIGLMLAPLTASAAMSINQIWHRIMPRADSRYTLKATTASAVVRTDVSFDPLRTRNFSAVTRPYTGTYCLTPTAGISMYSPPVATPEWYGSSGGDLQVYAAVADAGACSPGDVQVMTYNGGVASNSTAFTVWVPSGD